MKNFISGMIVMAVIGFSTISFAAIGDIVEAKFSQFTFMVDGEVKELEADPLSYQDTTYLPLRTVANMLGKDVVFQADTKIIELNTPSLKTSKKEVQSDVIDFSKHEPELIEGLIRSLEADLKRYPEKGDYYESQIAAGKAYMLELGLEYSDPAIDEINRKIAELNYSIVSANEILINGPDDESVKENITKGITKLKAELAELESQLATLKAQSK